MSTLELTGNLLTGIPEIDDQHQSLINLVVEFDRTVAAKKNPALAADVLDRLIKYTDTHFKYEEQMMAEYNYPSLEQHSELHQRLVKRIEDFQKMLANGIDNIESEIQLFLKDWLLNHILRTDAHYLPYANHEESTRAAETTSAIKTPDPFSPVDRKELELGANLRTGIESMDSQHQLIVDMINELNEAVARGQGNRIIGDIISRLAVYTQTHFQDEEALMEQYHYPHLDTHKQIHQTLIRRVTRFHDMHMKQISHLDGEILAFLKDWLVEHIEKVDLDYADCVAQAKAIR